MNKYKFLILLGIAIFLISSCEKEMSFEFDDATTNSLKQVQILDYRLDNIPVIENKQIIDNLLKNPEDSDDEKIKEFLYEISIATRELIKDANFNKIIIDLAKESPNQTANLLELEKIAPEYYGVINSILSAKNLSLSLIANNLTHRPNHPNPEYIETTKVEKYVPGIFIPNLSIADLTLQPIFSPNIVVDCRMDESIEDNIISWYYTKEGDLKEIMLSEETSLKTSNPLFLIDNISLNVKRNEVNILPPESEGTKSAQTTTTFSSYDYGIQNGYAYESWLGGKSEFCVVAYRIDPSGNIHWIYDANGWKEIDQISGDDIGTELYKWSYHADNWLPYTTNYVFWNTFERDWQHSSKSLGSATANGITVYLSGNRNYDEEWYTWVPETLQLHNTPFQWVVENGYLDFNTWKSWFSIYQVES